MKGYRFYADYSSAKLKRKGGDAPNVLAVATDIMPRLGDRGQLLFECAVAVFEHANSGVCWGAASRDYIAECCKRLSEEEARRIHPAIFVYLDS